MLVKFKYEPPISYWDCNVVVFKASIAIANLKNKKLHYSCTFPLPFPLLLLAVEESVLFWFLTVL